MHQHEFDELHRHLQLHPIGYPTTAGGQDMALLKKLFTRDEAGVASHLVPALETVDQISVKTGLDRGNLVQLLGNMADKGLIFEDKRKGEPRYALLPFLPGIWELQMHTMDQEFVREFEEIYPDLTHDLFGANTAWIRILAAEKSLTHEGVVPYQRASEVIKQAGTIAITDCVCRRERKLAGHGCSAPTEGICLYFTPWAEFFIDKGWGQKATVDEALKVLKRGEDAGLVHEGVNVLDKPTGMCQCCPCCCVVLRAAVEFKVPNATAKSDYYSSENIELCTGCGSCVTVCPVKAISLQDDKVVVNKDECLGCGICTMECPSGALTMAARKKEEVVTPPRNVAVMLKMIAEEKGKTYFFQ